MSADAIGDRSASCRISHFYLALVYFLSLATGVIFAFWSRDVISSMMCMAPVCRISIIGLGLVVFFPLLLSAGAVAFSISGIVYFIAFLDCISFGYCLIGSLFSFGTSGWLMLFLLSFSRIVLAVPKLYFYTQCVTKNKNALRVFGYVTVTAIVICMVDYFYISQILFRLMNCQ